YARFYGDKLLYFGLGVLESGSFLVIAFLLRDFYRAGVVNQDLQISRVFRFFLLLIVLFILTDIVKYFQYEYEPTRKRLVKSFFPWQILRLLAIGVCLLGWFGDRLLAARLLLGFVVIFTLMVCVRDFLASAVVEKKKPADPPQRAASA